MNRKLFLMDFFHESIANQNLSDQVLSSIDIPVNCQYALLRLSFLDNLEKYLEDQEDPYLWKQTFHQQLVNTIEKIPSIEVIEMLILEPFVRTFVLAVDDHFVVHTNDLFLAIQSKLSYFQSNQLFMVYSKPKSTLIPLSQQLKDMRLIDKHSYVIGYHQSHLVNDTLRKINLHDQTMLWIQQFEHVILLNTHNDFIQYIEAIEAYHLNTFDTNELVQFLHKEILIRLYRYAEKSNYINNELLTDMKHKINHFNATIYSGNDFITYLKNIASKLYPDEMKGHNYHPAVQHVIKAINNFYASDISLKKAAIDLKLSESHLSRLIKQELKASFRDILLNTRMREAKKLLIHTSLTIEAIAKKVGYTSAISFDRQFKKHEQMTPSHFRILAKVET